MITNSDDKDRLRLIELAKKASSEEVQNHLAAFDGNKIIVDDESDDDEDSNSDEPPPRGYTESPDHRSQSFKTDYQR